jgi:ribulose-5-phosphate 4-epimerase/fuculose-1-phosphate aldolase
MSARIAPAIAAAAEIDPVEWELRCDLAAAYRLIARFGMDDLIYTHLSMRVPGPGDRFLINPYGWMFDEITASSLVMVDAQGQPLGGDFETASVNPAGFVIHSAVHRARHDAACVMHTHTLAGMTIASLDVGLLPVNQISMEFYGRVAMHPYEGIAEDLSERERIVADLGNHDAMILANHGLLTLGRTVAEAFYNMYYLEQACRIQVAAMSTGAKLSLPPADVCDYAAGQFSNSPNKGQRPWAALRRSLDRLSPDYAT